MEQAKNEKDATQTGTGAANTAGGGQGRHPENQQQKSSEKSDDISQIDQQEGQMNNGELGGNLHMDTANEKE